MDVYKFPLRIKNSKTYKITIGIFNKISGLVSRIIIPKVSLGIQEITMVLEGRAQIRSRIRLIISDALIKIEGIIYSTIGVGKIRISAIIKELGKVGSNIISPKITLSTIVKTSEYIRNINIRIPKISFNAIPSAHRFYTIGYHSSKTIDQMDEYEFDSLLQSRLEDIYRKTLGER